MLTGIFGNLRQGLHGLCQPDDVQTGGEVRVGGELPQRLLKLLRGLLTVNIAPQFLGDMGVSPRARGR